MQALATRERMTGKDIMGMFLANRRSYNTRLAYAKDIENFFWTMTGEGITPQLLEQFLAMERPEAVKTVLAYKARLVEQGMAEATTNRRLAALRSLVSFARKIGECEYDLSDVEGEKAQSYRDVSGVETDKIAAMLAAPDRATLKGKRDYAILRLLWENALRRGEIVSCNVQDFDPETGTLYILGKGHGTQKVIIDLSPKTTAAIQDYLQARGGGEALFVSVDNRTAGNRLTGESIAYVVKKAAIAAGIKKKMSPHRVRHSSITAALVATGGDVTKVQKLSRHAQITTVMIYLDRVESAQKEVSELLSNIA